MRVEIYGDANQETVSGPTVQFTADDAAPVTDLKAQITPSIAGYSSVTIAANGQNTNVSLTKSVHGGSADITTGVVTETHGGGAYNPTAVPSDLSSKIVSATTARSASGSVASFNCSLGEYPMSALTAAINPVQDLHGYDNPWPAGESKQLIPLTEAEIKSRGSWDGNIRIMNGVNYEILYDDGGNVIGIKANGTATGGYSQIWLARFTSDGAEHLYTFSGITSGSSSTWYVRYVARDGNGTAISIEGSVFIDVYNIATTKTIPANCAYIDCYISVIDGNTASNIVFKPMICLSSAQNPTVFAPYSNICPISGWDAVGIDVTGKNLLDLSAFAARATARRARLSVNQDNTLTVTCTESGQVWVGTPQSVGGNLSNDYAIPINGGETIVLSTSFAVASFGVFEANVEKTITRYNTTTGAITLREDTRFVAFRLMVSNSMTAGDSVTGTFQVERGSQPTVFKPYAGNQYTITIGQTVYGGTLDVTTGKLTVDRVSFSALLSEATSTSVGENTARFTFTAVFANTLIGNASGANKTMCSITNRYAYNTNDSVHYYVSNAGSAFLWLPKDINTSTEIQIVATLATPIVYDLAPQDIATILGQNNVWADTGDVTVSYRDGLLSNVSGIMTNSTALTTGENITYTLSQERTFQIPGTVIRTVVGNNVMSASTGNISVTWSSHWFDITPWIAWQGLTFSRNDVDAPNAGRDMSGLMHRGRVSVKEKMNVQTVQLTRAQSSFLQTLLYPETIQVRVTPYPRTNAAQVMSMYTNNVKTTYVIHRENGEDLQSLSFPLIEN